MRVIPSGKYVQNCMPAVKARARALNRGKLSPGGDPRVSPRPHASSLRLRLALRERVCEPLRVDDLQRERVAVALRVRLRVVVAVREPAAGDDGVTATERVGVDDPERLGVGADDGVTGATPTGSTTTTRPGPPWDMVAPPTPTPSA